MQAISNQYVFIYRQLTCKMSFDKHIPRLSHVIWHCSFTISDENEDASDSETDDDEPPTREELQKLNIYLTTDNASNITKAVEESGFYHIRCFAHTVNLGVQLGLQVPGVKKLVTNIRLIVKHFRKSYRAKYALQVSYLLSYWFINMSDNIRSSDLWYLITYDSMLIQCLTWGKQFCKLVQSKFDHSYLFVNEGNKLSIKFHNWNNTLHHSVGLIKT